METVKVKKCTCGNEIKIEAEVMSYNQSRFRISGAVNTDWNNRSGCVCGKVHNLDRYIEKWINQNQPNRLNLPVDGWQIARPEPVDADCEAALNRIMPS
jgi:hypothetical protein